MSAESTLKVAAVQAAPVFLDLERSVEKACRLILEAADHGLADKSSPAGHILEQLGVTNDLVIDELRRMKDVHP